MLFKLSNCTKPLIMGWDVLVANDTVVNTCNMALIVHDKVVPMMRSHQYVPKPTDVTVSSTVTAMSEMIITARHTTTRNGGS